LETTVTLTMRDHNRYRAVMTSLSGSTRVVDTAVILNLSERQVYRLRRRVKEEGAAGVVHRLRGRPSVRRIPDKAREAVKRLYQKKYDGFNISHFTERLAEVEGIEVSREAIRRLLRSSGLYARAPRRVERHRERREPMEREGQMSQMDTSQHRWIPALGRDSYLVAIVDDATNKLQAGKFVASDSTVENMLVLKGLFRSKGLPGMIYLDRDSKFKTTRHGGRCYQVDEEQPETQIERALGEFGVRLIYAHSPQAKGRVERDFRTLQDRLLRELKAAGIETLEEANHYLVEDFMPRWNRRFARAPRQEGVAYASLLRGCHLDDVLCLKFDRRVYPDNTISYQGRRIQILADPYRANYSRARVELWEHLDGKITISFKGRRLRYRRVPGPTPKHRDDRLTEQAFLEADISTLQTT
jgi:transposase